MQCKIHLVKCNIDTQFLLLNFFSSYICSILLDIVFSTTHKSKGLEFDTVKLTDDYSVYDDEPSYVHDSDDDDLYGEHCVCMHACVCSDPIHNPDHITLIACCDTGQ